MRSCCAALVYPIAFFFLSSFSPKEMSLEEKVGQTLMVHFTGAEVNDDAKTLVQKSHVGGVIYYTWANGLTSPGQVRELSRGLQKLAQQSRVLVPLLIAIDQEGSRVARLTQGFTVFPSNKTFGLIKDPALVERSAFVTGKELRAVGINMNLAPVVDINNNPGNPVIGTRSYGSSPEIVIPFAESAIRGYHRAGVIVSIKHFPGHGDVDVDSHEDLPILNKSKEQLDQMELLPFARLADAADTVMTAHVVVPAVDPEHCATLSKRCLSLLRNDLGFKGVIVSDSLIMKGLLKDCPCIDEAALRAFEAGCDVLMLGGRQLIGGKAQDELTVSDVQRIHQALVDAVRSGRMNEERLDRSVQRILDLKRSYDLYEEGEIGRVGKHRELAANILSTAMQTIVQPVFNFLKSLL